jgi:hypothetical protein
VPVGGSDVRAGDEVLVVLDIGLEEAVTQRFLGRSEATA